VNLASVHLSLPPRRQTTPPIKHKRSESANAHTRARARTHTHTTVRQRPHLTCTHFFAASNASLWLQLIIKICRGTKHDPANLGNAAELATSKGGRRRRRCLFNLLKEDLPVGAQHGEPQLSGFVLRANPVLPINAHEVPGHYFARFDSSFRLSLNRTRTPVQWTHKSANRTHKLRCTKQRAALTISDICAEVRNNTPPAAATQRNCFSSSPLTCI